ncbi:polyprenyl synthetase family protein [Leucobacter luti]|uniref:Geranylgeranyl diphosphate synthase type II n=1 Tax=Leucobacter luti TaxID=340320 RepID=A0A4Q7TGM7_9MICO|nr:polyprenyl synthetase family protein [Leucobacter luti]MBL3699659.1 polyprenyl synthetase family protein [Leucobacter luti]RZT59433.1 geranylgeranyl diphosphate synthase type II [Leucobacter luti]
MTQTETRAPAAPDTTTREICAQIDRLIDARSARIAAHGPHFSELWDVAVHCLQGGKLLRPRLMMGAFDTLAGTGPAAQRTSALEVAAALEILHFSFLLHDDVIDEDLVRRGEPNLIGCLVAGGAPGLAPAASPAADTTAAARRTLHWARSSGLLVGDLMLTIAHQIMARLRLPEHSRTRVLDLLEASVTETVAGEYCDVGLADGAFVPDLSLVLDMTRMKTASYTFELPLRIAAVVAESPPAVELQLGEVGRHLGVAFQLQDDLLSAFSVSAAHGKDQFSDFREGKETALIAYARMTNAWPSIERLLGAERFSDDSGRRIQRLLTECGAREFIETLVQDQIRTALQVLTRADCAIPAATSRFILGLVDSLDGRRA